MITLGTLSFFRSLGNFHFYQLRHAVLGRWHLKGPQLGPACWQRSRRRFSDSCTQDWQLWGGPQCLGCRSLAWAGPCSCCTTRDFVECNGRQLLRGFGRLWSDQPRSWKRKNTLKQRSSTSMIIRPRKTRTHNVDGSSYPRWKLGWWSLFNFFYFPTQKEASCRGPVLPPTG